ncbi:MAG TPA: hypothetical protein VGV93_03140 [Acidimicrobiales bacterium]|nr:hypothetical protein [Acidimicrobiales bacterium]
MAVEQRPQETANSPPATKKMSVSRPRPAGGSNGWPCQAGLERTPEWTDAPPAYSYTQHRAVHRFSTAVSIYRTPNTGAHGTDLSGSYRRPLAGENPWARGDLNSDPRGPD